jgi:hypothetical protein
LFPFCAVDLDQAEAQFPSGFSLPAPAVSNFLFRQSLFATGITASRIKLVCMET